MAPVSGGRRARPTPEEELQLHPGDLDARRVRDRTAAVASPGGAFTVSGRVQRPAHTERGRKQVRRAVTTLNCQVSRRERR